jgi:hypothetical protein
MATLALCRLARFRADQTVFDLVNRNLRYNFERFYRIENDLGIIDDYGKVKLGAVALATLSLIEHRDREQYREQETKLLATVDTLWQADGGFRTFLRPSHRTDMQNFYPGEALLTWSALLGENGDEELRRRFEQSFRYYRGWHRENRNPAFIPWHTQAYFNGGTDRFVAGG